MKLLDNGHRQDMHMPLACMPTQTLHHNHTCNHSLADKHACSGGTPNVTVLLIFPWELVQSGWLGWCVLLSIDFQPRNNWFRDDIRPVIVR